MQEKRHLCRAIAGEIEVLGSGPHLCAGKMFEAQPAVGLFLQGFAPFHQPLGLKVLRPDKVGHLDFELLLRQNQGWESHHAGGHCAARHPLAS